MSLIKVVCPYNPTLIRSFEGYGVIVKVSQASEVAAAAEAVRQSHNRLDCIILDTEEPLDQIIFAPEWRDIPLAVFPSSFGRFRQLAPQVQALREFNLRVYLHGDSREDIAGLRILSSLGIHGCVNFGSGAMKWEDLLDLMTYALLERAPHASIEPFTYMAEHYDSLAALDWSAFYFNKPGCFVHLDEAGRVAMSQAEILQEKFIAGQVSELAEPSIRRKIEERAESWRNYFIDNHPCASCEGWNLCMGNFAPRLAEYRGCRSFFREALGIVRQVKDQRKEQHKERPLWQP